MSRLLFAGSIFVRAADRVLLIGKLCPATRFSDQRRDFSIAVMIFGISDTIFFHERLRILRATGEYLVITKIPNTQNTEYRIPAL